MTQAIKSFKMFRVALIKTKIHHRFWLVRAGDEEMGKSILTVCLVLATSCFTTAWGQSNAPSVADNASPQNNDIKLRSVELERVKRAASDEAASFAPISKTITIKFPQIKADFEGLQISQAAIIAAYTKSKTIDYALIETSANTINDNAKRLDVNLFAATKKDKPENRKAAKGTKPITFEGLIVELDTVIGSFVSSKLFGNLKIIEPEVAIKTRTDLLRIQELSEQLSLEAKRLKS